MIDKIRETGTLIILGVVTIGCTFTLCKLALDRADLPEGLSNLVALIIGSILPSPLSRNQAVQDVNVVNRGPGEAVPVDPDAGHSLLEVVLLSAAVAIVVFVLAGIVA